MKSTSNSSEIDLKKYLTDPVNETLQFYSRILSTYYEPEFPSKSSHRPFITLPQLQQLVSSYWESGGNLEKDLNQHLNNCLEFLIEFYGFVDPIQWKRKLLKKRKGLISHKKGLMDLETDIILDLQSNSEVLLKDLKEKDKEKAKSGLNELSIKALKVLEKLNGNLQSLKNSKIKEKMLIFCIIMKSFLNSEGQQGNRETVLKELEELKSDIEGNHYFYVLLSRIERIIDELNENKEEKRYNEEIILIDEFESDIECN